MAVIISVVFFIVSGILIPHSVFAQTNLRADITHKKISSIRILYREDIGAIRIADFDLNQGTDTDADGLSNESEIALKTDPKNPDTDADGYTDSTELYAAYDPLQPNGAHLPLDDIFFKEHAGALLIERIEKNIFGWYVNPDDKKMYFLGSFKTVQKTLKKFKLVYVPSKKSEKETDVSHKKIEVNLAKQKLSFYLDGVQLGDMTVSTGNDRGPTPIGTFKVLNKTPRAWSKRAGLWMPNWMAFAQGGRYGIHELPEWPNGTKEGANHLGKKVSHGCIRLGISDAKFLYAWAPIGTKVIVKKS